MTGTPAGEAALADCLCGHVRHDVPGRRWEPCGSASCGCVAYRPDPRPVPDGAEGLWICYAHGEIAPLSPVFPRADCDGARPLMRDRLAARPGGAG